MVTFIKQMFVGWFILTLITIAAYPQEPTNLSAAYPQEAASPPDHANPHDMMPAPRPLEVDLPAISGPATPFAKPAGFAQEGRQDKNGSDYFTGSGTEADPWLIATATDLDNVRHFVGEAHQDKHFRQTADIDLGVSPWHEGEGWIPIGNSIDPFHGHYDGSGHEISNLVIARDTIEYQGLFGRNNGTIMNLGVVNAAVTDNGSRAGILVGLNDTGVIDNCYTSGTIQCDHEAGRIGGLTGWNNGTIRNSSSAAAVHTTGVISGGLTGSNSGGGTLINCFATGEVIGTEDTGGLAGSSQVGGQVISCYATGEVSGTNFTGGLIGIVRAETTTDDCYATGNVRGESSVGGLVGYAIDATIQNSFFSGTVESNNRVGGLAGYVSNTTISDCYSEGNIQAPGNWVGGLVGIIVNNSIVSGSFSTADVHAEGYSIGGLFGSMESNSSVENAYATGQVSGMDWTGGLVGWVDESSIQTSFFSGSVEGENRVGGLAGTVRNSTLSDCYSEGEVHAREEFAGGLAGSAYSNSAMSGCFSTANVTGEGNYTGGLSGTLQSNSSIENAHFTGHVSGLDMTGGLVGWVGESFINNSFFSGSVEGENRVGGVAGQLRNATIMACYAKGEITNSGNWTGGIAGTSIMSSKVSESFAVTEIHSDGYIVGGLIGRIGSGSSIENAYSSGNLLGTNWVGGLVGWADSSSITNAYTANYMYAIHVDVSGGLFNGTADNQITNAFWNTETTGEEESTGGEGKTNAEMTAQSTFTGWDFDNTWAMLENETYPYLQWQDEPGEHNYPAGLYMLALTISPEEAGMVSRQGMRPEGSLNLINAATNEDYLFIEWTDAGGNTFSTDSTTKFYMPGHDLALTATFHALENTVSIAAAENGHVNPEGEVTVDYGNDLVVTITPDEGYRVAFIRLNGVDIDLENDPRWDAASGAFTVASVVVDQHLEVGFELITFIVTAIAGDNGHVNPEGEVTVDYGNDLVVTITPDEGYRVAFIRLNGVDIDLENDPQWDAASGTFTVASVVVDQHLEVGFELIIFTLAFVVTDARTGGEIPDAMIKLEDNWNDAGMYVFEQMVPGSYDYLVSKAGYFDKGGMVAISDDHLTEVVELEIDDTGLPAPGMNRLKVYPNPATHEIWVDLISSQREQITLRIYNMQGQVTWQQSWEPQGEKTLHINIGNLKPGVYLMALVCKNDIQIERLFIR
jgi:hypothetical protein